MFIPERTYLKPIFNLTFILTLKLSNQQKHSRNIPITLTKIVNLDLYVPFIRVDKLLQGRKPGSNSIIPCLFNVALIDG